MIKKFIDIYRGSPFVKNVSVLATGSVITQVISVLISPVLSRLYSPEDYGLLAVFLSVLNMASVIICFRYELAIVLPKSESDAINLVRFCLVICTILTLIMLPLSIFFSREISGILGNPGLGFWLPFLVLTIFVTGVYNTLNYFIIRSEKFKTITKAKVIQSVGQSAASTGFGLYGMTGSGLIISAILGQVLSALTLTYSSLRKILIFDKSDIKRISGLIKKYKEFPAVNMPLAILDIFSLQIIVVLISNFFTDEITGYYSFALRLLTIPSVLIGSSIGQVFYQKLSDTVNSNGNYQSLIIQTWKMLFLISIVPLIIVMIFAPDIFAFTFGEKWRTSGNISSVLCIMYFFMFLTAPVSSIYLIFKQQKLALIFTVISFFYRPLSIYAGYYYKNFMLGIILLVTFESLNLILLYSLLWRKVLKYKSA